MYVVSREVCPKGAALAFAMLIIAAGTSFADTPRFENPAGPGRFEWAPEATPGSVRVLNILSPFDNQNSATSAPGAFLQTWNQNETTLSGLSPNRVQRGPIVPSGNYRLILGLNFGDMIPSPAPANMGTSGVVNRFDPLPGDPAFCFAEGVPMYIGVRFNQGSGDQFGWIGVIRTGPTLDAFAWGYETQVGVPIAAGIPEPGSLAMLACGAAALLARRRS